jgi:lipopolysaccharide export system permease protein
MRRITRYVLAEFIKLFVVTVVCLTVVMVLAVVAQEAIRQSLGVGAVLRLLPYALPMALLYAVAGTTLFVACSIYGRMSAANEVTAVKSLGISPMSLLTPALLFAFLVSAGVVWLNDFAVSWGRVGLKRVVLESVEQIAYGMLRSNRSYSTNRMKINVKDVVGHQLIRPTLLVYGSADEPPIEVRAESAEINTSPEREALLISFTNGEIERGDKMRMEFQGTERIEIPLTAAAHKAGASSSPSDTPLRRIPAEIEKQRTEISQLQQSLASEAAYQMMTGDFAGFAGEAWQGQEGQLGGAESRLFRLQTEPWRRWANGFSCFAFVLVGAPLAIRLRSSDVWTSFLLCFLPILVVYYPLLAYGVDLAKSGDLPPYCVWMGNLVLVAVGFWMVRRVLRY